MRQLLDYLLGMGKQAIVFAVCGGAVVTAVVFLQLIEKGIASSYPVFFVIQRQFPYGAKIAFGIWLAYRLVWSLFKQPDKLLISCQKSA